MESFATAVIFEEEILPKARTGDEVSEFAAEEAAKIRDMQRETVAQVAGNTEGTDIVRRTEWVVRIEGQEPAEVKDVEAIADTLEQTGRQVRDIVGGRKTEEMEGNVAGYAYQGQSGSSTIDVTKAMQPDADSLVDTTALEDVVLHEEQHEKQTAAWNAEAVVINGQQVTRTDVSEADAMMEQHAGVENNSAEYQEIFARVTSLATEAQIRKTALTGDLIGLVRELNEEPETASIAGEIPAGLAV